MSHQIEKTSILDNVNGNIEQLAVELRAALAGTDFENLISGDITAYELVSAFKTADKGTLLLEDNAEELLILHDKCHDCIAVEEQAADSLELIVPSKTTIMHTVYTADQLISDQEERLSKYRGKETIGLNQKTLHTLDDQLLGLRKLMLLTAGPNVGKTALTVQFAIDVLLNNPDACVVYVSLEMTKEEIMDRLRCHLAQMPWRTLYFGSQRNGESGWFTKNEWNNLEASKKKILDIGKRLKIIDTESLKIIDTETIMEQVSQLREATECPRTLVVIDYLHVYPIPDGQNIKSELEQDKYRIGQMKELAKQLNPDDPLIVIAEARKPGTGSTGGWVSDQADISGSGRIAYAADSTLTLDALTNSQLVDKLKYTLNNSHSHKDLVKKIDSYISGNTKISAQNKNNIGQIIRDKLDFKGISIVGLTILKGRDGTQKGVVYLTYFYRENRFVEYRQLSEIIDINDIITAAHEYISQSSIKPANRRGKLDASKADTEHNFFDEDEE